MLSSIAKSIGALALEAAESHASVGGTSKYSGLDTPTAMAMEADMEHRESK